MTIPDPPPADPADSGPPDPMPGNLNAEIVAAAGTDETGKLLADPAAPDFDPATLGIEVAPAPVIEVPPPPEPLPPEPPPVAVAEPEPETPA